MQVSKYFVLSSKTLSQDYILSIPSPGKFLPKLKNREEFEGGLHKKKKENM